MVTIIDLGPKNQSHDPFLEWQRNVARLYQRKTALSLSRVIRGKVGELGERYDTMIGFSMDGSNMHAGRLTPHEPTTTSGFLTTGGIEAFHFDKISAISFWQVGDARRSGFVIRKEDSHLEPRTAEDGQRFLDITKEGKTVASVHLEPYMPVIIGNMQPDGKIPQSATIDESVHYTLPGNPYYEFPQEREIPVTNVALPDVSNTQTVFMLLENGILVTEQLAGVARPTRVDIKPAA